jgi:hypothetical protein
MAFFIDGPEARIVRTGDTSVELSIYKGQTYTDLEPRYLFPLSGHNRYITLLDSNLKEQAIIRDLSQLDPDSRVAVEQCLAEFYIIPKITGIIDVSDKYGVHTWTCRTDHGIRKFRIKDRHTSIKLLYDGRVLVRDVNDNRYEIENLYKLDKRSQHMLYTEV